MRHVLPSKESLQLIKSFESLHDGDPSTPELEPKLDPVGIVTYGWGRAAICPNTGNFLRGRDGLRQAMAIWGAIDLETANEWFAQDIAAFTASVHRVIHVELNPHQIGALVSLAYNIGAAGFAKSTVLRLTNARDFQGASRAFGMWNKMTLHGKKVVSNGLTRRRAAEAELFLTPCVKHVAIPNRPAPRPSRVPTMPIHLDRPEKAVSGDDHSLVASRTVIGGTIAAGAPVAAQALGEITEVITPLAAYSEYIYIALIVLGVLGGMLAVYARISDRRKGLN